VSDISLDRAPVVLRRSKGSELLFLLAGVCAVCIGIGLSFIPPMLFEAISVGVIGVVVGLVGFIQVTRPTTLTLAPEGLGYGILGVRRQWAWKDISGFREERIRSGKTIAFDVQKGERMSVFGIPAFFQLTPTTLVALLNDAKDRWSSIDLRR